MKLRTKVIALIVCLFAVLGVAQLLVQRATLLPGFAELERQSATTDMAHVTHALEGNIEQLAITAHDWGNWLDTYTFMSDRNAGYVAANLSREALSSLRLDALAYVGLDGELVWPTPKDNGPPSVNLMSYEELVAARPWFKALQEGRPVSGLLNTSRGPLLAGMSLVQDGSGAGAHRGVVLMGRLLTPEMVARIGRQAHVALSMSTPDAAKLKGAEAARAIEVSFGTRLIEGHDKTVVYKDFYDVSGMPLLTMRIEVPRTISARGLDMVAYASAFLLFAGAVALIVLIAMLNRAVLGPVTRLTRHARQVGSTGDPTSTLDLQRPDELGDLSREFDRMVRHLAAAKAQSETEAHRAQAASQAKTDFLAMMSHEIRTPMNGVLGCVSLLLDTPLRADQKELAQTIRISADSLLTILNDILDYSKIEAGRLTIEDTLFNLRSCCEDVHRLLNQPAAQRGIALTLDFSNDIPDLITGDSMRIRQVLLNLTSNAIKFTERGSVRIEVTRPDLSNIRMAVHDTGIGIAQDKLGNLFQHFTQADSSITRRYGGTGLGLAICKRLVDLMGGEIGAITAPGQGSTFYFVVPLLAARPSAEREATSTATGTALTAPVATTSSSHAPAVPSGPRLHSQTAARRILLVEDNPTNQIVAQRLLVKLGHTVDLAQHGLEALERLSDRRYDLVLMDCQMPHMDGLEATAKIRDPSSSVMDHAVPVVAMTANAFSEDRERCLAAGMNDFVSKPVDRIALVDVIARWAPVAHAAAADERDAGSAA